MKVFIIGDIDFLGLSVAKALSAQEITNVTLFGQCDRRGLERISQFPGINVTLSDTDGEYAVRTAVSSVRPEVVFFNIPKIAYNTHVVSAYLTLEALKTHPPKAVLVRSSYEVYDLPTRYQCIHEGFRVKPGSPYGAACCATEDLFRTGLKNTGTVFTSVRFSEIYGVESHPKGLVQTTAHALVSGHSLGLRNGRDRLGFIHVDEAAFAVASLIKNPLLLRESINVGSSEVLKVSSVVKEIASRLGQQKRVFCRPQSTAYYAGLDTQYLQSFYSPYRSLNDSINEILLGYQEAE